MLSPIEVGSLKFKTFLYALNLINNMAEIKNITKKEYSLYAKEYDRLLQPPKYQKHRKKELELIFSNLDLHSTDIVLDDGAGTGDAAIVASKFAKKVIAIDLSEGMLKVAKKKAKNRKNIQFIQMDAENLKFKNEYFDKIISIVALHYCPNFKKALSEIFRVLKTKGIFCVIMVTIPREYQYKMIFKRIPKWPTLEHVKVSRFYLPTPKLKNAFIKTGFKIEKFVKVNAKLSFFKLRK